MRRFLMAIGTSLLVIGLMVASYLEGILSGAALQRIVGLILLACGVFYVLFRSGLNLRCAEASLTVPQMRVSTLVILYAMYEANGGRAMLLVILLMIFLFGLLRLTTRSLIGCAAFTLTGYGGVICLLWFCRPQELNLRMELLQWCALAITMPWFAVMGGFIGGLRTKLHKRNEELQGLLQRVQISEASLAQAQSIAGLGGWTFDPLQRCATWSPETYRLFGVDPSRPALMGNAFLQLVHPLDQQNYLALIQPAISEGCAFDDNFRIVLPDGAIRWIHALGQPVIGTGGQTILLRGTVMDVSLHHAQQAALTLALDEAAAARATLVDAIECLNESFCLYDADDRLLLCNRKYAQCFTDFERFEDIAGMRFEDVVRSSLAKGEMIEPAFEGNVEAWVKQRMQRHRHPGAERWVLKLGNGRWVEFSEQQTRSGGIVGVRRDVTAQKQIEQRQAMEYAVTLLLGESATIAIAAPRIMQTIGDTLGWDCAAFWEWDKYSQRLTCAASWSTGSSGMAQFLVASSQRNFVSDPTGLIRRVSVSGKPVWIADVCVEPDFLRAGIAAQAGLHAAFAFPVKVGPDLYSVMEFFMRDVRQPDPALLATASAIGSQIGQFIARKAAEDEIRQLAFYDPLTGLPNRRLLSDRLQHALAAGRRSKRHGGLLFIDLDNFKAINDTLGHAKGDLLLQQVAARLARSVRVGDTVARQGGDEFVVMLTDLSEVATEAAKQAESVGDKILDALSQPYQFADYVYHNSASIGATLFDGQLVSTDEHLKRADLAMYQAKAAGRNTLRFLEADMQAVVVRRAALETDLRHSLQNDQFLLYYQAQIDAAGSVTGAEALLRWQHPLRGFTSPAEFIPAAEESGLILPLDDHGCHAYLFSQPVPLEQFEALNLGFQVQRAQKRVKSAG